MNIIFVFACFPGNTVRFDLTPNENFGEVPGSDKSTGDDANGGWQKLKILLFMD